MAVSDLIGTTWKFKNSGLVVTAETQGAGINSLEGTITDINNNSNTFNQLTLYPSGFGETNYVQFRNYNSTTYTSTRPIFRYTDSFGQWKVMLDGSDDWINTSDIIVTFTGGNTTEPELIAFMKANATQQTGPAGKTQIGTRAITKKMFGTREITKEVVNGVVVYEKQAPTTSYSVAITESNNSQSNLNYKSYLKIYDGQDSTGTLLVNSTGTTAMPQTSVTCTTGYLYLEDCSTLGGGYTQIGASNIVGNITIVEWGGQTSSGNAYIIIKVESDGSFNVGTDYNYD